MKKLVNFFITAEQHKALRQVAKQQGRTMSEVIRRGVDRIITRDLRPPPPLPTDTHNSTTTAEQP